MTLHCVGVVSFFPPPSLELVSFNLLQRLDKSAGQLRYPTTACALPMLAADSTGDAIVFSSVDDGVGFRSTHNIWQKWFRGPGAGSGGGVLQVLMKTRKELQLLLQDGGHCVTWAQGNICQLSGGPVFLRQSL